jgi:CheY-like chemotaxis protein
MKPIKDTHILIVDDEEFARNLIRRVVEMIGVSTISEASDGADAITKLQSNAPDVIILDIMMEPMNGLKFLKYLRVGMTSAPRELPVIVLTGSEDHAVLGKSMALDCNAFVKKPIPNQEALEGRLNRVLSEQIELKDIADYQAIKIPDVMPKSVVLKHREAAPEPSPKAYQIPIEDVKSGTTVARDIVSESGEVLLAEGSVISASLLNRMRDISEIIGLPALWVYS